MSSGHIVVDGAICNCKFGFTPDIFVVQSQQKAYANDSNGSKKLVANTMDIGMPLQAKTFGQCKLQPTSSGYLPCVPAITQWQNPYENIVLPNTGKILTEQSKAACAIAGSPCVEFTWHGQTAVPGPSNTKQANNEVQSQLNPLVENTEEETEIEIEGWNVNSQGEQTQYFVKEIEIKDLDEGATNSGNSDAEGMVYDEEYTIQVTKFLNDKPPKNLKSITWEYSYIDDKGEVTVGNIREKGKEITFKADNLDYCGKKITFYAYIENKESEATLEVEIITYPKIIFVNGHWNKIAHKLGMSPGTPGKGYWNFFTGDFKSYENSAKSYFGIDKATTIFVDGSSLIGIDQSGIDRKNAGYKYLKKNYNEFIKGLGNESIYLISHSEGGAFAAGIAKGLTEKEIKVAESIMLSTDEADEFSVEGNYTCYQLTAGYLFEEILSSKKYFRVDPVVGDNKVKGVTKYGVYIENAEFATVHGATIDSESFSLINKLKKVKTQNGLNSKGETIYKTISEDNLWYRIDDKIIYNERIDYYPHNDNNMVIQKYKPKE